MDLQASADIARGLGLAPGSLLVRGLCLDGVVCKWDRSSTLDGGASRHHSLAGQEKVASGSHSIGRHRAESPEHEYAERCVWGEPHPQIKQTTPQLY